MSKQIKAILTIIAGTIGVGFLALPYSIYRFGTIGGIILLIVVGILTLITNLTYSEIITSDKGNRQIPGYVKKYLGKIPAHIITVIIIIGYLGILLAYALISGSALKVIFSGVGIYLNSSFLGLLFAIMSLVVMRYGMQVIAKVSSWAVIALILAIILLLTISIPNISLSNVSPVSFSNFTLLFGVSIFALYSAGSIPVIDEIIGYDSKKFKRVVTIATIITLVIYILFGLILSLSFGDLLTSQLVDSFGKEFRFASIVLSSLTLLATFTSFVSVSNSLKEILNYDYKVSARTSIFLISATLIWALILQITSFETLVSVVGTISLALQSLAIFAIWFRSQKSKSLFYRILVGVSGVIIIAGMLL
ncbi:aromatic amino acid transport family protein [Patescibacteria group bacterium]